MTPERWRQVEEVYHSALEQKPDQRAAFLVQVCVADEELRREVESLLQHGDSPEALIDRPAWEAAGELLDTRPKDWAGQVISHYKILEKLGEGGMGEVYRAHDPRMGRDVAVKISAERFSDRFSREVHAVAALNHSNICHLYDVGPDYLVMELCEGETLAARLKRGKLSMQETVRYGAQIADALAAAHAKGIVHRDLKPGNVMLTKVGVKVLDFGLAKIEHPVADEEHTHSTTAAGTILGTAAYMSPEQAEGRRVDARSDIFSFGAVLYEMLAGRQAFAGLWRAGPAPLKDVAPWLQQAIARCLLQNPAERFQTAAELKAVLERTDHEAHSTPSIAVLAFANLSADKENEYFGDGLAEEILNALTQVPGLRVMARTSAFFFRDKDVEMREIGARLSVDHILEGSVRKAGDRIRVTVQLINAADGYHLWSERYDRRIADVFEIQDEISQAVVDKLRMQLVGEQPLVKRQTANLEAYNLYLKGRHWWNQFTGQGWRKTVECFEGALAEDPTYASPHAGLAVAYTYLAIHGWARPREVMPGAKSHALKALEMDETLAEAHCALGFVRTFYEWDWRGAESEYRRAMELNPRDALIRIYYSLLLMYTGRTEAAFAEARRAWELEPISEEVNRLVIYISLCTGRYDEAIAHGRKAVELHPHGPGTHNLLGFAHAHGGQYEEAIQSLQAAKALAGGDPVYDFGLGYVRARQGRRDEASAIVESLERSRSEHYFSPTLLAGLHGALGELDLAFDLLETACEERDGFLVTVGIDPTFGCLRSDPRYHALLKKINLA